jgi:excinuclease UvrABC nuclease subunit
MSRLVYRPPAQHGSATQFASWLRALRNQSGAYVIRGLGGKILYIGESHTGQLAKTISRHFFRWKDTADRQHFTFDRKAVLVAVVTCPPSAAVRLQERLIQRWQPRDNSISYGEEPF